MIDTRTMPSGGKREGAGRPPKKDGSPFDDQYPIRCFYAEHVAWKKAAKAAGKDLSDWVRETLNQAAKH